MCQRATIDISTIQILPEFISRLQGVDPDTVDRYREIIDVLPALKVWQHPETGQIYLLDGRHTMEASQAEHLPEVEVLFIEGDYEDALVQSRKANISHGLPYTKAEWRQAVSDIVNIRYPRTNAWIAREVGCSAPTVARIRAELEETGVIPFLEYLQAEDGRMIHRQAKEEAEGQVGLTAEVETPEAETAPEEISGDVEEEDEEGSDPTQTAGLVGKERAQSDEGDGFDHERQPGQPVKVTLKLGRVGEPIACQVGMWRDNGTVESIPVTLLITANQPKGLEEAAPDHKSCLIINETLARSLQLLND